MLQILEYEFGRHLRKMRWMLSCSHLEARNPTADSSTRQEMLTHHDDQGDLYGGEEDEGDHDGHDEGAKDVAEELVGDGLE